MGEVRGEWFVGAGRGGGGEGGWARIRERGILDVVSPPEVSSHWTVKVRRLRGPSCERIEAGCHWEWRDWRASTSVPRGGSPVRSSGEERCG